MNARSGLRQLRDECGVHILSRDQCRCRSDEVDGAGWDILREISHALRQDDVVEIGVNAHQRIRLGHAHELDGGIVQQLLQRRCLGREDEHDRIDRAAVQGIDRGFAAQWHQRRVGCVDPGRSQQREVERSRAAAFGADRNAVALQVTELIECRVAL